MTIKLFNDDMTQQQHCTYVLKWLYILQNKKHLRKVVKTRKPPFGYATGIDNQALRKSSFYSVPVCF
jgi:hypothetical protein